MAEFKVCEECADGTINDGKYLIHDNDIRIVDSNGDLVFKINDHDLEPDHNEINTWDAVKYCSCKNYWS